MKEKKLSNTLLKKTWLRKDSEMSPYNNGWLFIENKPVSDTSISSIINMIDELTNIGEE